MAQIQTITISNVSGATYETAEAMLTQLDAEVDTSTSVSSLDTWSAEGTLTQGDTILSEDGTTVTITRTWADARWADFNAMTDTPDFAGAGWTMVSEDVLHLDGMTTRRDDNFGND
jgi:hypothetical protein